MRQRILRIVAAAGAGRRMGAIKALLDLGGQSALERVAALSLPGIRLDTVVVVGHAAPEVSVEARRLGLDVAINQSWEEGQTGSIKIGLRADDGELYDRYLLHPVDLPLIARSSYEALGARLRDPELDQDEIVATSVELRRGHPIVFGRSLRRAILDLGPDESIRNLIAASPRPVQHVVVADPWVRRDLDHPEDLAAARAYLAASSESGSP